MIWPSKIVYAVRSLFQKRQMDEQLAEEVRTHVEMATEANLAKGMSPHEARHAALREFGNVASVQERTRDERGWVWLEQTGQDVRYAVRQLWKAKSFTTIAVVSLALGIGATTALFSLVDEVLLRSLPVKSPDELVLVRWLSSSPPYQGIVGRSLKDPATGLTMDTVHSQPMMEQLRDHAAPVGEVFAFAPLVSITIASDALTVPGRGQLVTGNYFEALGVPAFRGRMITPQDDRIAAAPVVVLSHRFWRQNLGEDPDIVGKVIRVKQLSATVIGIMPPDFIGTLQAGQAPDVTLPLSCEPQLQPTWSFTNKPLIWWLHVMARLKPGITAAQAHAQLEPVYLRVVQEARKLNPPGNAPTGEPKDTLRLEAGGQGLADIRRTYQQPLAILMGMVGLVLLLACVNVANLSLARSASRHREIAMRLSLGATRSRIFRQLLTETLVLTGLAGMCGLLVASWSRRGLLELWRVGDSGSLIIDQHVLAFTLGVSFVTALVFGLLPAWHTSRVELNSVLKGGTAGRPRAGWRNGLTVLQVALSMILMVGAGLLTATLWNLRGIDAGFNRSNLLLFEISSADADYSAAQAPALMERIRGRLGSLTGVQSTAFSTYGLLLGKQSGTSFWIGEEAGAASQRKSTAINSISPDYRRTLGIPLLLGRDLAESDVAAAPAVILVNETFARVYFPGENAVGRRITIGGSVAMGTKPRAVEIIGVVGNTHYANLRRKIDPTVLVPYAQSSETFGGASFQVRATGSAGQWAEMVRRTVREIDPALAVVDLRTQEGQVDRLFAREKLFAVLSALLGMLALVLGCIGLYGLLAQEVQLRTREIGIRMTIGAQVGAIFAMVMRSGLGLALLGCLLGALGSLGMMRRLEPYLYGVSPTEAGVFIPVSGLLLAVAGFACWLPARRAARMDPVIALRAE